MKIYLSLLKLFTISIILFTNLNADLKKPMISISNLETISH